jgi:hypothetical protein
VRDFARLTLIRGFATASTEYGRKGALYGDFGRYTFQSRLRHWHKFDPQDLSNYACQLIFENYGYDAEQHGTFDRNATVGTRGRNEKERIGKKYQWIALYEILARISDNHKMTEESSRWGKRKKYIWCQGPWEPFVRNIDPTVVPIERFPSGEKSESADTYSWLNVNFDFGEKDSAEWAVSEDGLPEPKNLMMATDYEDTSWLVLDTNPSWEERVPLGEEIHQFPHKRLWYEVTSYLLKEKEADKVISWVRKKHVSGREFAEDRRLYQVFSREFYWSPAYRFFDSPYYGGNGWRVLHEQGYSGPGPGKIMPTAELYQWGSRAEFDEVPSYRLPNEVIYKGMNLGYSDEPGEWVNSSGELVCLDVSVKSGESSCLIVKTAPFKEFLRRNKLRLFWTLVGEKVVYGSEAEGTRWLEISGTFILQDEGPVGEVGMVVRGTGAAWAWAQKGVSSASRGLRLLSSRPHD